MVCRNLTACFCLSQEGGWLSKYFFLIASSSWVSVGLVFCFFFFAIHSICQTSPFSSRKKEAKGADFSVTSQPNRAENPFRSEAEPLLVRSDEIT